MIPNQLIGSWLSRSHRKQQLQSAEASRGIAPGLTTGSPQQGPRDVCVSEVLRLRLLLDNSIAKNTKRSPFPLVVSPLRSGDDA
jgi:hypothetical protein